MRKGRSHRRTNRVSRPSLLGSNAHVESGGASSSSPQVVIGVTPSSPPGPAAEPVETPSTNEVATAAATAEVLPTPEPSAVDAEPTDPPASEKRVAAARPARFGEDTLIDSRPPMMEEHEEENETKAASEEENEEREEHEEEEKRPLLAASVDPNTPVSKSTLIMGSSRSDTDDAPKLALSDKASEPPPKDEVTAETVSKDTMPGLGEKIDLEEKKTKEELAKVMLTERDPKLERPSIEPTPTPSGMTLPIEDEVSVPPIVGEPNLERFFSEGDLARHDVEEVTEEVVPEKLKRKLAPHVVQRRARFVRYVTWAVGISAVVCLAAVARTAFSPKDKLAPTAAAAVPIVKDEAKPAAVAVADPPKTEAKEAPPAADAPKTEEAKTEEAKPEETKPEETKPAETAVAAPVEGDAKAEKKACKHALERGKLKDAVEAGEKSVAIDPTDGEAWLLLGASYQEMGKLAEARRCYTACVKEGKTGPRHECAKMLR